MKSMSQLAVLSRRWRPSEMKLDSFQEVVLESSSVEELKEKVRCTNDVSFSWFLNALLVSSVGKHRGIVTSVLFFPPKTRTFQQASICAVLVEVWSRERVLLWDYFIDLAYQRVLRNGCLCIGIPGWKKDPLDVDASKNPVFKSASLDSNVNNRIFCIGWKEEHHLAFIFICV